MKTKSLLITLLVGLFVSAFVSCVSCNKKVTDGKLKVMETTISHLEKNYRDMSKTEFEEACDHCMNILDEIAEGELTKNQKETIFNLKWRLRKLRVKYLIPFSEIQPKDDGLRVQDGTTHLSKEGLNVKMDTLNMDVYLAEFEKFISSLSAIHIKSADDTLQLLELEEKTANNSFFNKDYDVDLSHSKLSDVVKCMEDLASFLNEMVRLDEELKAIGIKSSQWNLGDDEEQFKATLKELQEALKLEQE